MPFLGHLRSHADASPLYTPTSPIVKSGRERHRALEKFMNRFPRAKRTIVALQSKLKKFLDASIAHCTRIYCDWEKIAHDLTHRVPGCCGLGRETMAVTASQEINGWTSSPSLYASSQIPYRMSNTLTARLLSSQRAPPSSASWS
jgi:hypothetical protein